jgi:hypothetical protein
MNEREHWDRVKEHALFRGMLEDDADWAGFAAQGRAVMERNRALLAVADLFGEDAALQVRRKMGLPDRPALLIAVAEEMRSEASKVTP